MPPASKPRSDSPRGKGPTPRVGAGSGTPRGQAAAQAAPKKKEQEKRADGAFHKDTKAADAPKAAPPKSAADASKAKPDDKRPKSAGATVLAAAGEATQGISAEMTTAVMSIELSNAIHAAADAAAAEAKKHGLTDEQAQHFYNVAENAAVGAIDPGAALQQQGGEDETSFKSRIETTLAKAIKKNAVRVMDLFKDWDADGNGVISKKEFRAAMRGLGIEGSSSDHDALFDK